jgi:hypothetical protein
MTANGIDVPNVANGTLAHATGEASPECQGYSQRSSRISLHLGHLPERKEVSGAHPRSPTKVFHHVKKVVDDYLNIQFIRLIRITPLGLPIADIMSTPSHM